MAQEAIETPVIGRLRALVEAGIALTSELSLDRLLQRLVETAAAMTGRPLRRARRDRPERRTRLERFVTTGLTPDDARARSASCRAAAASSAC